MIKCLCANAVPFLETHQTPVWVQSTFTETWFESTSLDKKAIICEKRKERRNRYALHSNGIPLFLHQRVSPGYVASCYGR